MELRPSLLLVLVLTIGLTVADEPTLNDLQNDVNTLKEDVEDIKKMISDLSRQTMLQQFSVEERSRINSDSGIKAIRARSFGGLKNYESPSHVGKAVYAIHDHSNYKRTLGLGELSVTMNGINFRTRHNDYKLVMPSTNSTEFRATERVPVPEVPPSVQGTLEEQIDEMREWFRAFKEQNDTVRDYKKYFKPVLCYLEGTWTLDKTLEEPFSSDRHQLDASSWFDLQEKLQFTSYTGSKSSGENIAYLPTAIMSVNSTTGAANYAQWNYRILCKPLETHVPLSALRHVDDLAYRMRGGRTLEQAVMGRGARFKIYDESRTDRYQLIDEMFYEVPGMDNLPSDNMTQATLGGDSILLDVGSDAKVPLKTGYYHRQYRNKKKGANGDTVNARGFNDNNLWVAQTTQSRVAPVHLKVCPKKKRSWGGKKKDPCKHVLNRFSYALPLELIYMTPLLSWNPHNITINDKASTTNADGANGKNKPYHGVDRGRYYITPYQFFKKGEGETDSADTARGTLNVYDGQDNVVKVLASGTRIMLREIEGVGQIRLRYPIAPVSDEGSGVWEELTALKDLVSTIRNEIKEAIVPGSEDEDDDVEPEEVAFKMSTTLDDPPGEHTHDFSIPYKLFKGQLIKGKIIRVVTEYGQGHTHALRIKYNPLSKTYEYIKCGSSKLCWDGHNTAIKLVTRNKYTLL